ncbi:hypothetical protein GCM10009566_64240 [Streptomyces murinus]
MRGEHPPSCDLHPLPCQQQGRCEVVGTQALESYEFPGPGAVRPLPREVQSVDLAQGDADDDER